ncbi:MAG: polysaccharide biosynthesis tyrosine autokinase [Candidatus Latescibacteria bacterium]|nr:polysaccharide biosynthesis tyrosine autokinase [Candidatus Latescibacterota bacterium]
MEDEKQVGLEDYIDIVWRRKWIILLAFVSVLTSTTYFTFTRPPTYEAASILMVEAEEGMNLLDPRGSLFGSLAKPVEFFERIMESPSYRDRVALKVTEQLRNPYGILLPMDEALELVKYNLSLNTSKTSDFLEIKASAGSPLFCYLLAAVGTEVLKQRSRGLDKEEAQSVLDFIEDQKIEAQQKLEAAERKLQLFRERVGVVGNEEEGGALGKLIELETELARVQAQKELAQANLEAYDLRIAQVFPDETGRRETDGIGREIAILESIRANLVRQSGEHHTEVLSLDKKIAEKKKQLIESIVEDTDVRSSGMQVEITQLQERRTAEELNIYVLESQERYYANLIEKFKAEHPNMLENAIELARLTRGRVVYESMYGILLEKGEEAKINAATGTGGIKVIEKAREPEEPVPAHSKRNLVLGAMVGMGLGLGIAFALEYMDNTIRTAEDLSRTLDLSVMGTIPDIQKLENVQRKRSGKKGGKRGVDRDDPGLISRYETKDTVVESYRALRTNLQFASVDKPLRSILISSPGPMEGKTLTVANLGISFSEMDKRTIIVDADLRRPRQHKLFGGGKEPGLTDYLVGHAALEDVIMPTEADHLSLIPAGRGSPNPAELLASNRMTDLIQKLIEAHDIVLFDTPPLIPVTDAALLASKMDGVLLVTKYGATHKDAAQHALEILEKVGAPPIGAILNDVEVVRRLGYYRYYYNYYYTYHEDEKKEETKA